MKPLNVARFFLFLGMVHCHADIENDNLVVWCREWYMVRSHLYNQNILHDNNRAVDSLLIDELKSTIMFVDISFNVVLSSLLGLGYC